MGEKKKVPESTISRLFVYLREVSELSKVKIRTISSSDLGERTNLSDVQVRKDLGYFGQFGVSGSGYAVDELKKKLEKILGCDQVLNVAIVGAGHLGSALLSYTGFSKHGLKIVAVFDRDGSKVGTKNAGFRIIDIKDIQKIVRQKKVSIGVIAVPPKDAQKVCEDMIGSGVECILNFAPVSLNVPDNVKVKDVDLSRELAILSYFAKQNNHNGDKV